MRENVLQDLNIVSFVKLNESLPRVQPFMYLNVSLWLKKEGMMNDFILHYEKALVNITCILNPQIST
jgi:hypothetical protein